MQWSLVMPLNPTSEDEEWFKGLTAEAGFLCDWRGLTFWQSESSKYPYVVDYFLENGRSGSRGRSVPSPSYWPAYRPRTPGRCGHLPG